MREVVPGLLGFEGWRELRKIGSGGWGDVYAGVDPESGETRAVKVTKGEIGEADPMTTARFRRELEISRSLIHPNVVRMHRTQNSDGRPSLVMEFCDLGSLADRLAGGGPLSVAEAVPLFLDVLDGLEFAHHVPLTTVDMYGETVTVTGIVHRDLKPGNILLARGPDGAPRAKLADFGFAKACESAGLASLTRTGDLGGSPAFMPRAQVLDYKRVAPGVDVWAAVASLYFALTGCIPRDLPRGRDPWLSVLRNPVIPLTDRGTRVPKVLADMVDETLRADLVPPTRTAAELRCVLATLG